MLVCALSLVLSTLLSGSLYGDFYLNWGILPAFIGMLYGNSRARFTLAALLFTSVYAFSYPQEPGLAVFNSGILLSPLLFSMAGKFKLATVTEKIVILWSALVPSLLLIALTSIVSGWDISVIDTSETIFILSALVLYLMVGSSLIYLLESAWDKLEVEGHIASLSEKFRRETDNLQQITDMVPLGIIVVDDSMRITSLNETMLNKLKTRLPQSSRKDIVNRTAYELIHMLHLDRTPEIEQMLDIIRRRTRAVETIPCLGKVIHIVAAPLTPREREQTGGMVIVIQDMTEEEMIRNELSHVERLTLVGQMAAGITHEIRNPMAVVRGFLQLMREKSPAELESYFQIVMEELDRANSIITDFLSLARSGISGKEEANLHSVIEELAPLLWADANLRGQSVELRLSESIPPLHINIKEIKQVILNLGRNAMEAMEPKGVLTLETRYQAGKVELLVSDTGVGMTQTQLEKLFVPFFTTKEQGTGLGLPLCLSIIERHGGTISVNSRPGSGTVFTVILPCMQKEEAVHA